MPGPGATRPSKVNWIHADKLALREVEVIATAEELNKLHGAGPTVTAANLDQLTDNSATGLHQHALVTGAYDVTATAAQLNSLEHDPGVKASAVLRVDGNVADGETVEIGADLYEVQVVNTDSTDDTAASAWDNVDDPLVVDISAAAYDNLRPLVHVDDLIRVETEIMKIIDVDVVTNEITLSRGRSNTTNAAHADAQSIFTCAAPGTLAGFAVGMVATLTPAVFTPALAAEINEETTEPVEAQVISNNQLLLLATAVGVQATALDEALMTADNVWDTAAMRAGAAPAMRRTVVVTRVPNATEVALDRVLIPLDFAPVAAIVQVRVTATGEPVAWDGNTILRTVEQRIDVINSGLVDFAETDTITAVIYG